MSCSFISLAFKLGLLGIFGASTSTLKLSTFKGFTFTFSGRVTGFGLVVGFFSRHLRRVVFSKGGSGFLGAGRGTIFLGSLIGGGGLGFSTLGSGGLGFETTGAGGGEGTGFGRTVLIGSGVTAGAGEGSNSKT